MPAEQVITCTSDSSLSCWSMASNSDSRSGRTYMKVGGWVQIGTHTDTGYKPAGAQTRYMLLNCWLVSAQIRTDKHKHTHTHHVASEEGERNGNTTSCCAHISGCGLINPFAIYLLNPTHLQSQVVLVLLVQPVHVTEPKLPQTLLPHFKQV